MQMINIKKESRAFSMPAILPILMLLFLSVMGNAQTKLELSIGDAAPPLSYAKWIKGVPTESLTGSKIYVLEFWATWCKPCIEAMPHLSDLADKYADKMKVIAVNVSERTGSEPYESSLPKVEAFLAQNSHIMRFDVITDNNQREMNNNWLRKGNIVGIPATIIVRDNKILWIGHPLFLDNVLTEIFENTYDMKARKIAYEAQMLSSMSARSSYNKHVSKIDDALAKRDYFNAIIAADEAIRVDTASAFQYRLKKLHVLLSQGNMEAVAGFLNSTIEKDKGQGLALAGFIANQQNLAKECDEVAIQIIKKTSTDNAYYLDLMAFMQDRIGDHAGAASTQEHALATMKENELMKPGKIKPETFAEFENKIQKYKQAAQK
ncbi:Thiol-disulfide oxidoreductase YkuV [compost metagenome]